MVSQSVGSTTYFPRSLHIHIFLKNTNSWCLYLKPGRLLKSMICFRDCYYTECIPGSTSENVESFGRRASDPDSPMAARASDTGHIQYSFHLFDDSYIVPLDRSSLEHPREAKKKTSEIAQSLVAYRWTAYA